MRPEYSYVNSYMDGQMYCQVLFLAKITDGKTKTRAHFIIAMI